MENGFDICGSVGLIFFLASLCTRRQGSVVVSVFMLAIYFYCLSCF